MSKTLVSQADAEKASSHAILNAGIKIFEAAALLRAAPGITKHDLTEILTPAIQAVHRQVLKQTLAVAGAAQKPAPSVIQNGPDKAADFLRAVHRDGQGVSFS